MYYFYSCLIEIIRILFSGSLTCNGDRYRIPLNHNHTVYVGSIYTYHEPEPTVLRNTESFWSGSFKFVAYPVNGTARLFALEFTFYDVANITLTLTNASRQVP